jgi:hypothetical protein
MGTRTQITSYSEIFELLAIILIQRVSVRPYLVVQGYFLLMSFRSGLQAENAKN